jgi:hypothetical protein
MLQSLALMLPPTWAHETCGSNNTDVKERHEYHFDCELEL